MAQRKNIAGLDTYTISSQDGSTQATFVPERGGVGSSLIMPGKQGPSERLFHYPHLWDKTSQEFPGGWPFCFPVCGRLEREGRLNNYYYDGHVYELPIHGFAVHKPWSVTEDGDDRLRLMLRDDEQTRQAYPFHFTVELLYEMSRGRLTCHQTYTNHGDRPMPYYAGFHPYFHTPEPHAGKEQVILNYQPVRRFRYNTSLTDLVGEQPLFDIPTHITNDDINEQLTQVGEDKDIHLRFPNQDVLNITAEGVEDPDLFPYIQLYTQADQPFFCVEPWMGYPNALNSVTGTRWLQPGQSEHGVIRVWME